MDQAKAKSMAAAIVGKTKAAPPAMAEDDEEYAEGAESAASDLLAAIEAKSTSGIVEAFKALRELC